MEPLFEHRRSTRHEGYRTLLRVGLIFMGFVVFYLIFQKLSNSSPDVGLSKFWWVFFGIAGGISGFLIFFFAIPNIRMNRHFSMRIFPDRMECESPHPNFGPSYTLTLEDISHIERNSDNEWVIVCLKGEVFQITPNYGNPRQQVLEVLQRVKPGLEIRNAEVLSSSQPTKTT